LPYANRLAPEIWLDGSGDADWSLNLFSRGGAQCAGRNLALVLATASLAELLREAEFGLLNPKLSPDRPLPYGINPLTTRFWVSGVKSCPRCSRERESGPPNPACDQRASDAESEDQTGREHGAAVGAAERPERQGSEGEQ